MKPLFTIHAGEYLVGSHIEKKYPNWHVWIPSADKGIDLLVSNTDNSKTTSIQVKFSKDYSPHSNNPVHRIKLVGSSWFSSLNSKSLSNSQADLWVLVIHSFKLSNYQYVIISPRELLNRLNRIHPGTQKIQSYLWVTKEEECWETRKLNNTQKEAIVNNDTNEIDEDRNFTSFLNNWGPLEEKL